MMSGDPPLEAAALLQHLLTSYGPDVTSEWKAGCVRYARAGQLFCIVKPLAKRCDVGFFKFGRAGSRRILAARGRLPFVPYLVEIEAPGDIDTKLRAWLRGSYEAATEGA
ncbi:MAG TPA: DUF5655 domain-containing protein [Candidatus Thermoplasmatota archaeon]|nr:DUF5655 domain-containing protein [Candidatus Thermoplasmatota archaeon]